MASKTMSSSSQRNITSTTADKRSEVSCVVTSRGGCTRMSESTATITVGDGGTVEFLAESDDGGVQRGDGNDGRHHRLDDGQDRD